MKRIKNLLLGMAVCCISTTVFAQEMEKPVSIFEKEPTRLLYAAPVFEDMDNDGLEDLVLGTFVGEFLFFKNKGTKTNPVYDTYTNVQANGEKAVAKNW